VEGIVGGDKGGGWRGMEEMKEGGLGWIHQGSSKQDRRMNDGCSFVSYVLLVLLILMLMLMVLFTSNRNPEHGV
jgi:hypothetical protein